MNNLLAFCIGSAVGYGIVFLGAAAFHRLMDDDGFPGF